MWRLWDLILEEDFLTFTVFSAIGAYLKCVIYIWALFRTAWLGERSWDGSVCWCWGWEGSHRSVCAVPRRSSHRGALGLASRIWCPPDGAGKQSLRSQGALWQISILLATRVWNNQLALPSLLGSFPASPVVRRPSVLHYSFSFRFAARCRKPVKRERYRIWEHVLEKHFIDAIKISMRDWQVQQNANDWPTIFPLKQQNMLAATVLRDKDKSKAFGHWSRVFHFSLCEASTCKLRCVTDQKRLFFRAVFSVR